MFKNRVHFLKLHQIRKESNKQKGYIDVVKEDGLGIY